jgi:hypothetical protein
MTASGPRSEAVGVTFAQFGARKFAQWLVAGMRSFFGFEPMTVFSPGDAFLGAGGYIGLNQFDLAADLVALHDDLPPHSQGQFAEALSLIWAELDFDQDWHFRVGEEVLTLACRIRAKALVDVLSDALPRLLNESGGMDESAQELHRSIFDTAVELAAATQQSVWCLRQCVAHPAIRGAAPLVTDGEEALEVLGELGTRIPGLLPEWLSIFAPILADTLAMARPGTMANVRMKEALFAKFGADRMSDLFYALRHLHEDPDQEPFRRLPPGELTSLIALVVRLNPDRGPIPDAAPMSRTELKEMTDELGDSR